MLTASTIWFAFRETYKSQFQDVKGQEERGKIIAVGEKQLVAVFSICFLMYALAPFQLRLLYR